MPLSGSASDKALIATSPAALELQTQAVTDAPQGSLSGSGGKLSGDATISATGTGGSERITIAAASTKPSAPVLPTLSATTSTGGSPYFGNRLNSITNADWNAEFGISQVELQHLLRLIHPNANLWGGPINGTTQQGTQFLLSGVRSITSNGNNLTNAFNRVGTPASEWANPDTAYVRMINADYGQQEGDNRLEALGKPRGYQGTVATVDGTGRVTFNAITEATTQFTSGGLRNARTISNVLGEQSVSAPNTQGINVYHMSIGQYIDHGVDFTARSASTQSYGAAVGELGANTDDYQKTVPATSRTGVLGGQAAYYLRESGSGRLVQVLWMKNSNGSEGLYELVVNGDGTFNQGKTASDILGRAAVANDVLFLNKTEALFQANQTYGSSEATAYILRETARYNSAGAYTYSWTDYGSGSTQFKTLTGGVAGALVWDSAAYGTSKGAYIKTTEVLTSRVRAGDGLQALPTYAEVLLNNGVHAAVIKLALNPGALLSADEDYLVGLAKGDPTLEAAIASIVATAKANQGLATKDWVSVARLDARYIDNGNVFNYDVRSKGFGTYANEPLNGDLSPAVNALDLKSFYLFGIDQNCDNITDLDPATGLSKAGQPGISTEDWGAGSLLSHLSGGDWRSNENAGLSTSHTTWLREHNFLQARIRAAITEVAPANWRAQISDDDIFEMAREILIGEYQKMVYTEYLPALAGTWGTEFAAAADHGWGRYNPLVDASASLEFATAAFRTPHSTIPENLIPGINLFSMFLSPQTAMSFGPTAITDGLLKAASEALDTKLVDAVRNNLVTSRVDLLAANVMRNRALGIADFQSMKKQLFEVGPLNAANGTAFSRITVGNALFRPDLNWAEFGSKLSDWLPSQRSGKVLAFNANDTATYGTSAMRDKFMFLYGGLGTCNTTDADANGQYEYTISGITTTHLRDTQGLNSIDAYIGMLAEKPTAQTGQVGALASYFIWENADRQQEGDRMYYLDRLKLNGPNVWSDLDTFGDIIERTSTPELALTLDTNREGVFKVMASINPLNMSSYQQNYISVGNDLRNVWNLADPWANAIGANVGLNPVEAQIQPY
jgi:hypothetical protein